MLDPMDGAMRDEAYEHYARGLEWDRLTSPLGEVEFTRTQRIVLRHLPPSPALVADVGGGPGRYTLWLASLGYQVRHRDLVRSHVAHVATEADGAAVETAVGDARRLDLADGSVDAVLLLGPLYHLEDRDDRVLALTEAGRVVRPGGFVFAAAISRWAPRLDGILVGRIHEKYPDAIREVSQAERDGVLPALGPGSFCGYTHRPAELTSEVRAAGLDLIDLAGVEGLAFALPGLPGLLRDPAQRAIVLDSAEAVERVPELLGLSPHLLATAQRKN